LQPGRIVLLDELRAAAAGEQENKAAVGLRIFAR